MTQRMLVCCFVLALAPALPGAPVHIDSLKVGSMTYQNVTVIGHSETDLYFTYSGGIANVKLKYLEAGLQQRFDYDPKVAEMAERQQTRSDATFQESVSNAVAEQAQRTVAAVPEVEPAPAETLADPLSDRSPLNKPAPKLTVVKWLGDAPVTDGKTVIVLFWATRSLPCRQAISQLNACQKKFNDQLAVIGISAEPEPEVAGFAEPKLEFSSAIDPNSKLAGTVGVTSVPQVLLIDSKGIVRYVGHPAALDMTRLERLLAKPPE